MPLTINPGYIGGSIHIPASKSMMQRICAAALLHKGKTVIHNPGISDDDHAALHIVQQLGAQLSQTSTDSIQIISNGLAPIDTNINCGESGLSARMFISIAAMNHKPLTISGRGTLLRRPMHPLAQLLPRLGVTVSTNADCLPFHIQGPLQPQPVTIDGSTSSQFLTGFLFAYAYCSNTPVTLHAANLKSRPYIDMTLQVLDLFGKTISHNNYTTFLIDPTKFQSKEDITVTIESDWSSAAFWLVAGAISGDITLTGLNMQSAQADKAIYAILQQAGAAIQSIEDGIRVNNTKALKPFTYDATHTPDLFPILAVLAACCNGISHIQGIHRLIHKESNRLQSINAMLSVLGVHFSIQEDILIVHGGHPLKGGTINAFHDHRIAMAAAVSALVATSPVTIMGSAAVTKSYPQFFSHLSSLGAKITST